MLGVVVGSCSHVLLTSYILDQALAGLNVCSGFPIIILQIKKKFPDNLQTDPEYVRNVIILGSHENRDIFYVGNWLSNIFYSILSSWIFFFLLKIEDFINSETPYLRVSVLGDATTEYRV